MVILVTSKISSFKARALIHQNSVEKVTVCVSGAVRIRGAIDVPVGSEMKEAVQRAVLLPEADLCGIDMNEKLYTNRELCIPLLKKYMIEVTGATKNPGRTEVPVSARICDLKKWIDLTDDADKGFFKSRRKLKNNEVVCIPRKAKKYTSDIR